MTLTAEQAKQAAQHLRNVLKHRLQAWDESLLAEKIVGEDIDTESQVVEYGLSCLENTAAVDKLTDAEVLNLFSILFVLA